MQRKFAVVIALALSAAPVSARDAGARCDTNINGTYSVTCQGFVGSPFGFVPAAVVGLQTNSNGTASGAATVSIAGQSFTQDTTGTAKYNDDCISGTIDFDVTAQGVHSSQSFAFVVLDHGDRISSIATVGTQADGSPAMMTLVCVLERISRVPAPAQ